MRVCGTIDTDQCSVKLDLHTGVITMSVTTKMRYGLLLLVASAVLVCTNLQAARPDRSPGVYIPILKNTRAGEFSDTSWVSGAQWRLP